MDKDIDRINHKSNLALLESFEAGTPGIQIAKAAIIIGGTIVASGHVAICIALDESLGRNVLINTIRAIADEMEAETPSASDRSTTEELLS